MNNQPVKPILFFVPNLLSMKPLFVILSLFSVFITSNVFAQSGSNPIQGYGDVYTYDGAGNRVKREYLYTIVAYNKHHEEQPVDTLKENFDSKSLFGKDVIIKAYPNPVADEMIVENLSWKDGSRATVKILDITGKLLQDRSFNNAKEQFSLSGIIPGTYTVSYYLNDHLLTTWKIIKK